MKKFLNSFLDDMKCLGKQAREELSEVKITPYTDRERPDSLATGPRHSTIRNNISIITWRR